MTGLPAPVNFHDWREVVNEAALMIPTTEDRERAIVGGIARLYRTVGHPFPAQSAVKDSVDEFFLEPIWRRTGVKLSPLVEDDELTHWRHAFAAAIAVVRERRKGAA